MSYVRDVNAKVRAETRAVICRGYVVTPSSRELANSLWVWTRERDGQLGDMSLQLIVHCEDLAADWEDRPFIVGVFVREVYGLDGDHRLGLTAEDLESRVAGADARLDEALASLRAVVEHHGAVLSERKLLFTWGGPLCSARLVKGTWREEAEDEDYFWAVEPGRPGVYFSREGASQDAAPGGAFGFAIAEGVYDNNTPPFELTPALLSSRDEELAAHGVSSPKLFVFSHYD